MKVYLHFPRVGHTMMINDVQFINGVADIPWPNIYLERYYNVKNYAPEELQTTLGDESMKISSGTIELDVQISSLNVESVVEKIENNQDELKKFIEEKKQELNKPKSLLEQFDDIENWGKQKAFLKEKLGFTIATKRKAREYLSNLEDSINKE